MISLSILVGLVFAIFGGAAFAGWRARGDKDRRKAAERKAELNEDYLEAERQRPNSRDALAKRLRDGRY